MSATLIFKFKKNPLQILQWSSANAVINGRDTIKVPWTDETRHNVETGHYSIQMSFPYMGSEVGKAYVDLDIRDGEELLITYKPPLVVFSAGTILVQKR